MERRRRSVLACGFACVAGALFAQGTVPETAYGAIPEWDSVMHLRLVMETEARYGSSIPLEAIPRLARLADFAPYLNGRTRHEPT